MTFRIIAGHTFDDLPEGRVCITCNRRWVDIASATSDNLGEWHIAHSGVLTEPELAEIEQERDRIWRCIAE